MTAADTSPPTQRSWRQLRPLLPYLRRYRGRVLLGLMFLFLTNLTSITGPLVIREAINSIEHGVPSPEKLLLYAGLLLAIALATGFFRFWQRWILICVSRDVEYDLRNDLFRQLAKQSARFYTRWRIGDLMTRLTSDVQNVRMVLGPGVMYTAGSMLLFPLILILMFYLNWRLTLVVLLPVPLVSLSMRVLGKLIHDFTERIQAKFSAMTARVQENLAGVRLLRAFVQEEAEERAFDVLNRDYVEENRRLIRFQGLLWPALGLLLGVTFLLVFWLGGRDVLDVGSFYAFSHFLGMLIWPMIALGWVVNIFERGAASMGRLNLLLTAAPEIVDRAPADAPDGAVLVDGRPVSAHCLETLRGAIGYVPQETFLFSDTLRENIALGAPGASEEAV